MRVAMQNEYFDRFLALTGEHAYSGWQPVDAMMEAVKARFEMVLDYAWAVPDDRALGELASVGPIVEVGAGGGYWAALLRARGVDVLAYDCAPVGSGRPNAQVRRSWSEVERAPASISRRHPDRALFLCWPPYSEPMAHVALFGYLQRGGKTLAYVGEGSEGCTGDQKFHDLIEERMEEVSTHALPRWPGIHDRLTIYTRKE